MTEARLFVCSGAKVKATAGIAKNRHRVDLDSGGSNGNVKIRFENVARILNKYPSPRLLDFLEIASYVFSADCATNRGNSWDDDDTSEPWERDFAFVIPVRDPKFWQRPDVMQVLIQVLNFLSNDKYSFQFASLEQNREIPQDYFEFGEKDEWAFYQPERVVMFSGGLDSLAGVVEMASKGKPLVLVSHRSVSTLDSHQKQLFGKLNKLFPGKLIHVPVWINKQGTLRREHTQRTRSFLYTALGAVVGNSIRAQGLRFYENGVISINLPVAEEALRARASRTTHPITLHLLGSLCSLIGERDFVVDNPYQFMTKTEVVETLTIHKVPHLVTDTCSCSHMMFKPRFQRHCGTCSQCIDRRIATTAAGLQQYDLSNDYVSDVFIGARKGGYERNMAIDYTRHGLDLCRMDNSAMAAKFNVEIGRAIRVEPKQSDAAQEIISMHQRHGESVAHVLSEKVSEHAEQLTDGKVEKTSLLAMVIGRGLGNSQPQSQPEHDFVDELSQKEQSLPTKRQIQTTLNELVESLLNIKREKVHGKKQRPIRKRDAVMYAAIRLGLEGTRYCRFLDEQGIRLRVGDSETASYSKTYIHSEKLRKKIQDEKSRARGRMKSYKTSQIMEAINEHVPHKFDEVRQSMGTRHSQNASESTRAISGA